MKQHKWHKEIKAWADGAEIECKYFQDDKNKWSRWMQDLIPLWHDNENVEYRIKLQPKKPNYLYVYGNLEDNDIRLSVTKFEQLDYMNWYPIGRIKLEDDE